jgi:hypothetical protein
MTVSLASRISIIAMAAATVLMTWLPTVSIPLATVA